MKDITVTEYSHVLSFVREALEKSTLEKHILVHLSRVLLEVAPEGSLLYFQVFIILTMHNRGDENNSRTFGREFTNILRG